MISGAIGGAPGAGSEHAHPLVNIILIGVGIFLLLAGIAFLGHKVGYRETLERIAGIRARRSRGSDNSDEI